MNAICKKVHKSRGVKVFLFTLVMLMIFRMFSMAFAVDGTFVDVSSDFWAYEDIMQAYKDGAVEGTGFTDNGQRIYNPSGNVTMAQFIAILTRAFYAESVEFSDENYAWYAPNYDVAIFCDFFDGVPDTDPNIEVSREVMAQIMYRLILNKIAFRADITLPSAAELQATKNKIPDFGNVNASMQDAVAVCYALNLITGVDNAGSLRLRKTLQKAVAFISQWIKQMKMEIC